MRVADEFDAWAADGRDQGMADRHWHTAKDVLTSMPVEAGDDVLDLGTGSGYALRALLETRGIDRGYGLDGSLAMLRNGSTYTESTDIGYVAGTFGSLPFGDGTIDHVFSMEAIYYATEPVDAIAEVARVLRPGGTFHCGVNYFAESEHTARWQEEIAVDMTRWNRRKYREAFRRAGLYVAAQTTVPDRETEIPPASAFPVDGFDDRESMVDRYRTWGTLVTVGVAP